MLRTSALLRLVCNDTIILVASWYRLDKLAQKCRIASHVLRQIVEDTVSFFRGRGRGMVIQQDLESREITRSGCEMQGRYSPLISVVDSGLCVDQSRNNLEGPGFGSIHQHGQAAVADWLSRVISVQGNELQRLTRIDVSSHLDLLGDDLQIPIPGCSNKLALRRWLGEAWIEVLYAILGNGLTAWRCSTVSSAMHRSCLAHFLSSGPGKKRTTLRQFYQI
mmetsp:Transcript_28043/g.65863  ORF Transcript_28043/g.65863 Transcript_28043/m.65863 type:complete len:221 (-) Transcript_28043:23-685(-)